MKKREVERFKIEVLGRVGWIPGTEKKKQKETSTRYMIEKAFQEYILLLWCTERQTHTNEPRTWRPISIRIRISGQATWSHYLKRRATTQTLTHCHYHLHRTPLKSKISYNPCFVQLRKVLTHCNSVCALQKMHRNARLTVHGIIQQRKLMRGS